MRLILDTHYVYALAGTRTRISERESRYLTNAMERFIVSAASIWEIRIKWQSLHSSGVRKGPASPDEVLQTLDTQPVDFLPITERHAATALSQPIAHRDPFDEILLTQAQVEGVRLLTRDKQILAHPLAQAI
ncbi:MAG: type II toxin-antitoxin system VapC family toxin [Hyphomonadaceae bacterium]|nr:type II toxin-antitoxin system VapC family toxin [Hyphomonadaceae bacterium]